MTSRGGHTLMTVHAHPDDETVGTGGVMAKAARQGHRVVVVTCTGGEVGEIIAPDLNTPENQRRLGELRSAELARALRILGVAEWEFLGYRDSGMMGSPGNDDPRSFWRANLDEAAGRLVWLVRQYRPQVLTTYNNYGGYGHPDHIRAHDVAVRAFDRAGDPAWYPEQLEAGLEPWAPLKLYEQVIPASLREAMEARLAHLGRPSPWSPPDGAGPEERAIFEAHLARMMIPDASVTTWIDVGDVLQQKWDAIRQHVSQISDDGPFLALGLDGWRDVWRREAYILRESRVKSGLPEVDVFAGLE
jgi:N-acetyl-1-D-myo-inositol-2-amino-2-deoxy-alpha-D-glucopyranoside deacetylase